MKLLSNFFTLKKKLKQMWRNFFLHLYLKFLSEDHQTKGHSKIWSYIYYLISKGYLQVQSWSGLRNSLHVVSKTTLDLNWDCHWDVSHCLQRKTEKKLQNIRQIMDIGLHRYDWFEEWWNEIFYVIVFSVYVVQSKKTETVCQSRTYPTYLYYCSNEAPN